MKRLEMTENAGAIKKNILSYKLNRAKEELDMLIVSINSIKPVAASLTYTVGRRYQLLLCALFEKKQ